MDKIYCYSRSGVESQSTRYPPEQFGDALISFFDEYTNTRLETMELKYQPRRLSDPIEAEHHKSLGSGYLPLEPDEEVEKTMEYINNLDVISVNHEPETSECHLYKLHISSYDKVINLLYLKSGVYISSLQLRIDKSFNFKDYDYAEIEKNLGWCKPDGSSNILVYMYNNYYTLTKKCDLSISSCLYFPEISEKEKQFLREIGKKLKIRIAPKGFSYYYKNKKGKICYKKEKIVL